MLSLNKALILIVGLRMMKLQNFAFFSLQTRQGLLVDRRSEPRTGERVPYVIVYGTPGQPLIQLVRRPQELLDNPGLRLNGTYYVTKQLMPPLDRCFSLLGVDVRQWSVLEKKFITHLCIHYSTPFYQIMENNNNRRMSSHRKSSRTHAGSLNICLQT